MSEAPDQLEAELSALRPHEVSPGLRGRVALRLADARPAGHGWRWRVAVVVGVAACLAALIFWWGIRNPAPRPRTDESVRRVTPRDSVSTPSPASRQGLDEAETPKFAWPLQETPPMRVSITIPPDLLD